MILGDGRAPIFVIGAARSGTKFLRDVLAAGRGARAVPYDVNYVWRYGHEFAPDDRLDPATQTERQRAFIRRTLPELAGIQPGETLIEKTVSNTLRAPYVEAAFPGARYVHLIRDGRDVTESAMRMWKDPPDWGGLRTKLRQMPWANLGYALWFGANLVAGRLAGRKGGKVWGPRYPGIDADAAQKSLAETCAWQWRHTVQTARADLARLPADRVFEIRYEDLTRDDAALRKLVDSLALPDPEGILAAWKDRLVPEGRAKWTGLPVADQASLRAVSDPLLRDLGYDIV